MIAIMRDAIGVGLAATQLGVMHRLLVFQAGPDATPTAIANPELEWMSDEVATAEEGCLSLPRVAVDVERPLYARVRGVDIHGEPLLVEASGLEARVLQHELDHLDGVLMLDRTTQGAAQGGARRAPRRRRAYSPHADADRTKLARPSTWGPRSSRRRCCGASRTRRIGPPSWSPRLTGREEGGAVRRRRRSPTSSAELGLDLHSDRERATAMTPSTRFARPTRSWASSARSAS